MHVVSICAWDRAGPMGAGPPSASTLLMLDGCMRTTCGETKPRYTKNVATCRPQHDGNVRRRVCIRSLVAAMQ